MLEKLPNGHWIDQTNVIGIFPSATNALVKHRDGTYTQVHFETREQLLAWADEFAVRCNVAKSRDPEPSKIEADFTGGFR